MPSYEQRFHYLCIVPLLRQGVPRLFPLLAREYLVKMLVLQNPFSPTWQHSSGRRCLPFALPELPSQDNILSECDTRYLSEGQSTNLPIARLSFPSFRTLINIITP